MSEKKANIGRSKILGVSKVWSPHTQTQPPSHGVANHKHLNHNLEMSGYSTYSQNSEAEFLRHKEWIQEIFYWEWLLPLWPGVRLPLPMSGLLCLQRQFIREQIQHKHRSNRMPCSLAGANSLRRFATCTNSQSGVDFITSCTLSC